VDKPCNRGRAVLDLGTRMGETSCGVRGSILYPNADTHRFQDETLTGSGVLWP
jgi:hypothetical protein